MDSTGSDTFDGLLVEASPHDRYFDYCLQPYRPRRPPTGKLRSESLLWHSFAATSAPPLLRDSVRALQGTLGRDSTVFGIKWDGSSVFWELYFYDPQRSDPRMTVGEVAATIKPYFSVRPVVADTVPFFMFSFELSPAVASTLEVAAISVYLAEPTQQAGRSYRVTSNGFELENLYHFLHPKTDIDEVLHRIRSSLVVDFTKTPLSKVLLPELFTCNRICVAKKRTAEAVYYSGISVEQLQWFLGRFDYPRELQDFLLRHKSRLDHLSFDVGVDYRLDASGALRTTKSSYYGIV